MIQALDQRTRPLDSVITELPTLSPSDLLPAPGNTFILQDNLGYFLHCFRKNRAQITKLQRKAMQFAELREAVWFGKFWLSISNPGIRPIYVCEVRVE